MIPLIITPCPRCGNADVSEFHNGGDHVTLALVELAHVLDGLLPAILVIAEPRLRNDHLERLQGPPGANGVSGYDVETRSISIPPGGTQTGVQCPSGEAAISGGWDG